MLLELLNNIIQYQYKGNAQMIYSIIRRKEILDSISELTLPAALRDAHSITQIGNNEGSSRSAVAALALAAAENKSHEAAAEEGDSIEPCVDATLPSSYPRRASSVTRHRRSIQAKYRRT